MKPRGQTAVGDGFDGFDRNVAEKMPKIRKEEDPVPSPVEEEETQPLRDLSQEVEPPPKPAAEKKPLFAPPLDEGSGEENLEVLRLIDDLHGQLLISNRTKRALEMDLAGSQRAIQKASQENQGLRTELERMKKELQRFQEAQSELAYLEGENEDALEKIAGLQAERKGLKAALADFTQERDQALHQIQALEARIEQADLLRMKERMKEREVSHFSAENQELRMKWEETLARNVDLEKKYEALRRSFNEVRESLTLMRDACKVNYYSLPEASEPES